jgi:hypothetical protein
MQKVVGSNPISRFGQGPRFGRFVDGYQPRVDVAFAAIVGLATMTTIVGLVAVAVLGPRRSEAVKTQRRLDSYRRRTLIRMTQPRRGPRP